MILFAISVLLLVLLGFAEVAVVHWAFRLLDAAAQGQSAFSGHELAIVVGCFVVGCLPLILVVAGLRSAWRTNRTDTGQAILVAGGTLLLMVFASGFSMQEMSGWARQTTSTRATLGQHL